MTTVHLWSSVVSVMVALAVPVPSGERGTLTSLESRRGRAADVLACAARSRRWRVLAAAAAIAR